MLFLGTEQFPEESSASVFAIIPLWRRLESAAPGNPVFSFCFWTRFRCLSDCEQRFFQRLHRGRGPSWLDPAMEPSRNSSSYWCVVHCLVPCLQHLRILQPAGHLLLFQLQHCRPAVRSGALWNLLSEASLYGQRDRERGVGIRTPFGLCCNCRLRLQQVNAINSEHLKNVRAP